MGNGGGGGGHDVPGAPPRSACAASWPEFSPFSTTRARRSRAQPSHPRAFARSFGERASRLTISSTSSGFVKTRGRDTPARSASAMSSSLPAVVLELASGPWRRTLLDRPSCATRRPRGAQPSARPRADAGARAGPPSNGGRARPTPGEEPDGTAPTGVVTLAGDTATSPCPRCFDPPSTPACSSASSARARSRRRPPSASRRRRPGCSRQRSRSRRPSRRSPPPT